MNTAGHVHLLFDLLTEAKLQIEQKDMLIRVLKLEVARLNQRRDEFEISADSELPCFLRRQAT